MLIHTASKSRRNHRPGMEVTKVMPCVMPFSSLCLCLFRHFSALTSTIFVLTTHSIFPWLDHGPYRLSRIIKTYTHLTWNTWRRDVKNNCHVRSTITAMSPPDTHVSRLLWPSPNLNENDGLCGFCLQKHFKTFSTKRFWGMSPLLGTGYYRTHTLSLP